MDTFSKLGWFFKAHRKRYALGITALVLTSAANLVPPRILGMMADQLDTGKISWQHFLAMFWQFCWRLWPFMSAAISGASRFTAERRFWKKNSAAGSSGILCRWTGPSFSATVPGT